MKRQYLFSEEKKVKENTHQFVIAELSQRMVKVNVYVNCEIQSMVKFPSFDRSLTKSSCYLHLRTNSCHLI